MPQDNFSCLIENWRKTTRVIRSHESKQILFLDLIRFPRRGHDEEDAGEGDSAVTGDECRSGTVALGLSVPPAGMSAI
jgi:hypothetical protein